MSGLRRLTPLAEDNGRQDAERLVALIRDCVAAGIQRRCLMLRLSLLPRDLARPHHLRLAREAVDPLLAADRAQAFALPNRDLAVIWRGRATEALAEAHAGIGRLFADVPTELFDPASLCLVLDVPEDVDQLVGLTEASLVPEDEVTAAAAVTRTPLDPASLARLETALARADVSRFARRSQVSAVRPAGGFTPAWETRILALDELAAELSPERSVRADPWLFARLCRTLDRRMLTMLADPNELRGAGPFALDLNAASILTPEFLRFDAALPQGLRGHVALGLGPGDVLADLAAFLFARDFAHARGYRLLLRLDGADLLAVLPLDRLGLDLLQLRWSRALLSLDPPRIEAVAARTVLAQADSEDAISWGRVLGIRLFSGRAVPASRGAGYAVASL